MRHVILTCVNHPNLRWSCKEIAVSNGRYNGARRIFFLGTPTGAGMYDDGSGLRCTTFTDRPVNECECNASTLIVAPEDKDVKR
jgi:hypothetical protein